MKSYQNSKYLVHQTNKHPLQVVRAILWNSFPEKKILEYFSKNLSKQPFCRPHTNNFFWSLDVFPAFYKETLLYTFSEFVTNRKLEEQVL